MIHRQFILFVSLAIFASAAAFAGEAPFHYIGSYGETIRDSATTGTTTYYAQGALVRIVDQSNLTEPRQIGSIVFAQSVYELHVHGNALYIFLNSPDDGCSIHVYDISDNRHPRFTRVIPMDKDIERIWGHIFGPDLWVFEGTHHLRIADCYDVTNPLNPARISYQTRDIFEDGVKIKSPRTELIYALKHGDLLIADGASSPTTFAFNHGDDPLGDMLLHGNALYIIGIDRLYIIDLSNSKKPRLAESIALNARTPDDRRGHLYISGTILWNWTTGRFPRLSDVFDVSTPLHPIPHPSIKPQPLPPDAPSSRTTQHEPARPAWVNEIGSINDMDTTGSLAYLAGGFGLQIIDFSDPTRCVPVGSVEYPKAHQLLREGSIVYLAGERSSLGVIEASDRRTLKLLQDIKLAAPIRSMRRAGHYLFAADASGGLVIFDIKNPNLPELIATRAITPNCTDIVISGRYAFVAAGNLHVIDISDPLHIKSARPDFNIGCEAQNLILHKNTLLINGDADGRCVMLDVSDPTNPKLQPTRFEYIGQHLAVFSNLAISSESSRTGSYGSYSVGTLNFYDISNPTSPIDQGALTTPWGVTHVFMSGDMLFACNTSGGLMLYRRDR